MISIRANRTYCQAVCDSNDGHLPYLFEGMEFNEWDLSPESPTCHQHRVTRFGSESSLKVGQVVEKLFVNNSFNRAEFPAISDYEMRRSGKHYEIISVHCSAHCSSKCYGNVRMQFIENISRDYRFYISADYNFESRVWKSWWFEIDRDRWKESNTTDYEYPTLDDHIIFYSNPGRLSN